MSSGVQSPHDAGLHRSFVALRHPGYRAFFVCTTAAMLADNIEHVISYALAIGLLFAAGFFELSFNTMAQTLVQLNAPAAIRGRIIGLFATSSLGLRAFSGVSVGVLGSLIGIHRSLAASAPRSCSRRPASSLR